MKLEVNNKIVHKTNKIKVLVSAVNYPYVVAGHYNGSISLLDFEDQKIIVKKSENLVSLPIRAIAISLKRKLLLVGSDDGKIRLIDSESLQEKKVIDAHDDFIRSIVVDDANDIFLSSSDDCTVKQFDMTTYSCKQYYSDFKHFIMDLVLVPDDSKTFLACSLDGKVRQYSIFNNKRLETFYYRDDVKKPEKSLKGILKNIKKSKIGMSIKAFDDLSGINSIDFIDRDCFATVNDGGFLTIFDRSRRVVVLNEKIMRAEGNKVKKLGDLYGVCSSDGSCYIFSGYDMLGEIATDDKVWDVCIFKNRIIIGNDDGLTAVNISNEFRKIKMGGNRFITQDSAEFLMKKIDDVVSKELGSISDKIIEFYPSGSGKLIAVIQENGVFIYSILGLRKRLEFTEAVDARFDENEEIFVLGKKGLVCYDSRFSEIGNWSVNEIEKFLFVSQGFVLASSSQSDASFLIKEGKIVHRYSHYSDKGALVWQKGEKLPYVFLFRNNQVLCFYGDKQISVSFERNTVKSYFVYMDVLFFNTSSATSYVIFDKETPLVFNISKVGGELLGICDGKIYDVENERISSTEIDLDFISYQQGILRRESPEIMDSFRSKVVGFFESLEMYEEALNCCENANQKFGILLKLNRFDEAITLSDTPAKHNMIGNELLKAYRKTEKISLLQMASECFLKSGNYYSLFITDLFSDKKYLKEVSSKSFMNGNFNLSLLAYYKDGDFTKCAEILKNTEYYELFCHYNLD